MELVLNLVEVEVALVLLDGNRLVVRAVLQPLAFPLLLLALRSELVELHMNLALVLAVRHAALRILDVLVDDGNLAADHEFMLALFELLLLVQRVPLNQGALDLLQVQLVELLELVDLLQLHEEHLVGLDLLDHGDELLARLEVQRQHLDVVQQVDHLVVLKEGVHRLLHVHFEALVRPHYLVGVVLFLNLLGSIDIIVVVFLHLLLGPMSQLHILLEELHKLLVVDVAHSAYTI